MPSFVGNVQIKLPDEAPARNPKYWEPLANANDPPTNAVIPIPIPPSIVNPSNYSLSTFETAPIVVITDGVSEGDSLTITTLEGRLLYINGEQIGFDECDIDTNTVSGLTRGANGTGAQADIPLYSEVYGIIPENRMTDVVYSSVWNSNIYNTVEGDPLQISQTVGANFLKVDRS